MTMFTITFCKRIVTDVSAVVVVQLQLLDLMIRKEGDVVPMAAATRAGLIDLMARVLVVVFHEKGGRVDDRSLVQSQDQRRIAQMPLPSEVGKAIADYLSTARPPCANRRVFIRAKAPLTDQADCQNPQNMAAGASAQHC
jgi:hypothetical protein